VGGGLLLSAGTATVNDCTIANVNATSGGGVAILGGTATVNNTILGTNTGGGIVKTGGTLTGVDNLISDSTYQIAGLTNTVHANPLLGNLANNGGPTQTMALPAGSPAIDAGNNGSVPMGVTTDQRGIISFTCAVSQGSTTAAVISSATGLVPRTARLRLQRPDPRRVRNDHHHGIQRHTVDHIDNGNGSQQYERAPSRGGRHRSGDPGRDDDPGHRVRNHHTLGNADGGRYRISDRVYGYMELTCGG
jgi:hypothetical protein